MPCITDLFLFENPLSIVKSLREYNTIYYSSGFLIHIILGNLIAYPLKINCPIVKSRREYNANLVLVYPVNKCVLVCIEVSKE